MKLITIGMLFCLCWILIFAIDEKEKKINNLYQQQECIHKHNKDLIWIDNILQSKDTVIQYFEDGSHIEFYPSKFKNK